MNVTDPPTVSQDELLQLIGELEDLCADLQDVNAEVSAQITEKLQRLRKCVMRTRSSRARRLGWEIMREALRVLAAEVVKRVIETSISNTPGLGAREWVYQPYDGRRVHQNTARVGRAQAA